jgi:uncharacterized membrane protein YedE/YeeE
MNSEKLFALASGLSIGTIFGFALEKSKVYLPTIIREQMKFQSFTMLKMFLMATGVSTIVISLLDMFNIRKRKPKSKIALGFGLLRGYGGNILGGGLLGMGMTLAGGCPGTLVVGLGAGVEKASYAFAGGVAGAMTFGYLESFIRMKMLPTFGARGEAKTIDKSLPNGLLAVSLIFGGLALGAVFAIEKARPWVVDLIDILPPVSLMGKLGLTSPAWPPVLAGTIIGTLQIPALLSVGTHIGTSSSYCTLAGSLASCFDSKVDSRAPYFSRFFSKEEFMQLGIIGGLAAGGFLSTYLSSVPSLMKNDMPAIVVFLGSALMIFGARLGGGCTSGHGISGMATLSVASFVSVMSMFAGGMLTALFV